MIQVERIQNFFEENGQNIQDFTDLIHLIGNPIKFKILWIAYKKPTRTKEISKILDMSASATTQHITMLKDQGLLIGDKDGKNVFYRLHPKNEKLIRKVFNSFKGVYL